MLLSQVVSGENYPTQQGPLGGAGLEHWAPFQLSNIFSQQITPEERNRFSSETPCNLNILKIMSNVQDLLATLF